MSPGLASSGTGTVTSPVFSSTFTPSGALSPGLNVVPSGASVSLPSLSLKVGASIVTSSPGLPEPSVYSGVKSSFCSVFGASSSTLNGASARATMRPWVFALPSSSLTGSPFSSRTGTFKASSRITTGNVKSLPACSAVGVKVTIPVAGSTLTWSSVTPSGSLPSSNLAFSGLVSSGSVFGLSNFGLEVASSSFFASTGSYSR